MNLSAGFHIRADSEVVEGVSGKGMRESKCVELKFENSRAQAYATQTRGYQNMATVEGDIRVHLE